MLLGQFLSCGFMVLLRKSIPQNHNLKTAAELGVNYGGQMTGLSDHEAWLGSVDVSSHR
jgi:hypothetical protein